MEFLIAWGIMFTALTILGIAILIYRYKIRKPPPIPRAPTVRRGAGPHMWEYSKSTLTTKGDADDV